MANTTTADMTYRNFKELKVEVGMALAVLPTISTPPTLLPLGGDVDWKSALIANNIYHVDISGDCPTKIPIVKHFIPAATPCRPGESSTTTTTTTTPRTVLGRSSGSGSSGDRA
jgi:hypothetical protein